MDSSFDAKKTNQNGLDSGPSCFLLFSLGNFGIFVSWSKLILRFLYSLSVVLLPKQSVIISQYCSQFLSCWMTKFDTVCNSFLTILKVLNDSLFPLHKLPVYCKFNSYFIYVVYIQHLCGAALTSGSKRVMVVGALLWLLEGERWKRGWPIILLSACFKWQMGADNMAGINILSPTMLNIHFNSQNMQLLLWFMKQGSTCTEI